MNAMICAISLWDAVVAAHSLLEFEQQPTRRARLQSQAPQPQLAHHSQWSESLCLSGLAVYFTQPLQLISWTRLPTTW